MYIYIYIHVSKIRQDTCSSKSFRRDRDKRDRRLCTNEIEDEYDVPESFVDKQIAQNEYIFSGRLEIDYITQKYHLNFEGNEDAETLSGYIIQNHQSIPKQKERIIIGNFEFDILNVSDTRIETVKVKVLK